MPGDKIQEWARVGAQARLVAIDQERAAILNAFPELHSGRLAATVDGLEGRRKRRFSAAAKKRMAAGMKKYWARRRAAAKAKTPAA